MLAYLSVWQYQSINSPFFKMQVRILLFGLAFLVAHVVSYYTMPVNGTIVKDIHSHCDNDSLGLVESRKKPGVYYVRGVCSGLYNDQYSKRCSFLDLNMCYQNVGGNIYAQKLGHLFGSCKSCILSMVDGAAVLTCTCTNKDGSTIQRSSVHLDDLLSVKNGFLSCYGYTNFECPHINVPY
ncbi:hypothetical protein GGR54DRAFT_627384 [Hypoxylon sp. NC1633]|nr:hypothetical protein GGR54DRAFT_627384 [Hypoxylon sp. NC1633]